MPLYDFRCADCTAEQEVHASFAEADGLELICTGCGGTMTRTLSKTAPAVLTSRAGTPPPHPSLPGGTPPGRRKTRARTCEDGAVRLTRPNPFAAALPRRSASQETG